MMKLRPLFAAFVLSAALPFNLFSAEVSANQVISDDTSEFINQQDLQALREWIATKRQVTVKQVGGDLSISGEVRVELQKAQETKNGVKQRGPNSANPRKPTAEYDIEVNLMFDYRTDRTWTSAKIEFDNSAGSNLNIFDNITIERAIFGGRALDGDTATIDLEVGRRNMGNVYDSKIQFGSFLDGITARYDLATDQFGDFYARFSPFLIDEQRYQWGVVGEIAVLNAFNTGLYAKYSIIDWKTKDLKNQLLNLQYNFVNSQWILGYKFIPGKWKKVITIYSSFLINTEANNIALTNNTLANKGCYAGFSIGKVRNKGDWSLDANYQYVQAQAIPIFDASGIGRGNASRIGFYTVQSNGKGEATTIATAVGKTNYQGVSITLLYLLTDTITIYQNYQYAVNANKNIGPKIHYNQYELEFIYAF
ncbi:MAG: hypothetical protein P0S95_03075 [Rhabdochlamydiaceae bacterium]|nr:hypothetical protein [Candidatus Amphrikana amoebophyrae]